MKWKMRKKNYVSLHIPKIWQILKHFSRALSWAQTSYFWAVIPEVCGMFCVTYELFLENSKKIYLDSFFLSYTKNINFIQYLDKKILFWLGFNRTVYFSVFCRNYPILCSNFTSLIDYTAIFWLWVWELGVDVEDKM